jgi:hypothetical protein
MAQQARSTCNSDLEYKKEDSRITLANPNLVAYIKPDRSNPWGGIRLDEIRQTQLSPPKVAPCNATMIIYWIASRT